MALAEDACLKYLEKLKWKGSPKCPYCESPRFTRMVQERRYHCNYCFTSYSVTVNTIFHRSHVKLKKWFKAIFILETGEYSISARQLAKELEVTNNTALSMKKRIQKGHEQNPSELKKIATFYKKAMDDKPKP